MRERTQLLLHPLDQSRLVARAPAQQNRKGRGEPAHRPRQVRIRQNRPRHRLAAMSLQLQKKRVARDGRARDIGRVRGMCIARFVTTRAEALTPFRHRPQQRRQKQVVDLRAIGRRRPRQQRGSQLCIQNETDLLRLLRPLDLVTPGTCHVMVAGKIRGAGLVLRQPEAQLRRQRGGARMGRKTAAPGGEARTLLRQRHRGAGHHLAIGRGQILQEDTPRHPVHHQMMDRQKKTLRTVRQIETQRPNQTTLRQAQARLRRLAKSRDLGRDLGRDRARRLVPAARQRAQPQTLRIRSDRAVLDPPGTVLSGILLARFPLARVPGHEAQPQGVVMADHRLQGLPQRPPVETIPRHQKQGLVPVIGLGQRTRGHLLQKRRLDRNRKHRPRHRRMTARPVVDAVGAPSVPRSALATAPPAAAPPPPGPAAADDERRRAAPEATPHAGPGSPPGARRSSRPPDRRTPPRPTPAPDPAPRPRSPPEPSRPLPSGPRSLRSAPPDPAPAAPCGRACRWRSTADDPEPPPPTEPSNPAAAQPEPREEPTRRAQPHPLPLHRAQLGSCRTPPAPHSRPAATHRPDPDAPPPPPGQPPARPTDAPRPPQARSDDPGSSPGRRHGPDTETPRPEAGRPDPPSDTDATPDPRYGSGTNRDPVRPARPQYPRAKPYPPRYSSPVTPSGTTCKSPSRTCAVRNPTTEPIGADGPGKTADPSVFQASGVTTASVGP